MVNSNSKVDRGADQKRIPQFNMIIIILMFVWPAIWYTVVIYIIARQFIPEGGMTPTWVLMASTVLGTGAELVTGLALLRREGYPLRLSALRERIRWRWPKSWKAWLVALVVFILGVALISLRA